MWMCGVFLGLPSASGHLYAVGLSRLAGAGRKNVLVMNLEDLCCHFIVVEQRWCIGEGLRPTGRIWLLPLQWIAGTKCSRALQYRDKAADRSPSWSFWTAWMTRSFCKEETAVTECRLLQLSIAYACVQTHAWRHMWGRHELKHSITCAQSLTPHIIHGHLNLKHACQHPFLILLLLSQGSLHSACAPCPRTGGWRTLQRWSAHLDFALAVATEDLCSPWIPWPQEGADAQNTTLLCYIQSGQSEGKEQQIVARDFLLLHHYFLSKDDLKTLYG